MKTILPAVFLMCLAATLYAEELGNGDFSIGTPGPWMDTNWDVGSWNRENTSGTDLNIWLTKGATDPLIGAGNQALKGRWENTQVYQVFTAAPYETYAVSVDAMLDRTGNRWKPQVRIKWYDSGDTQIGSQIILDELDPDTVVEDVWHSIGGNVLAPAGAAKGRVELKAPNSGNGGTAGIFYFDNASVTNAGVPGPASDLEAGLHAYWKFDGGLTDSSVNDFDGTASGGISYTAGIAGQAVSLDASTDRITVSAGDIPRPWTISVWVKKQATGNDVETLLDSSSYSIRLDQAGSGDLGATEYGKADMPLDIDMPDGQWTHVAFVANTHTMSAFVDGFAYGVFSNNAPFQSIDLPLDAIGATAGADGLIAELDEFGVWIRELNAAEIRHLYLGGQAGETIDQIGATIDGQPVGLPGPGITQQSYGSVGQLLKSFDLNSGGLSGEEGRAIVVGYRDGWVYIDARNIANRGGLGIYDFSDFTNPRRVSQFYNAERPEHLFHETIDPALGHYYQNNTFVNAPGSWDLTQFPALPRQTGLGYTIRRSPDVQAYMVPPYAYYGQYGYPRSHKPMEIWDMRTDTQIASLDFENDLGFRGVPTVFGNLMLISASNTGDGVAAYDISDPSNPVLLNVLYGVGNAYEPAIYCDKLVLPGKDANGNQAVSIVDFSNPSNLVLEAQFNVAGNEQYAHFQDNYMFVGNSKVDMNTYTQVHNFGKGNQYLMPIGNVVFIIQGKGVAHLFSHQQAPDTTGPAVKFHLPADGAVNQAVTSRIGIFIPESLRSQTINPSNCIVRVAGGEQIDGTYTYCDKSIINFTPRSNLLENTTYEVYLAQGGIEDIVGNGLSNDYSFTFSTGSEIIIDPSNLPPVIASIDVSAPAPLALNQDFVVDVTASDPEGSDLQYRWQVDGTDSGWTSDASFTNQFAAAGRYILRVSVRDSSGVVIDKVYVLTAGTLPAGPAPVNSGPLALDTLGRLAWTVNPDNDTVTSVNLDTLAKVSEIVVGDRPSSCTVDAFGRVWVACRDADRIDIVDGGTVSSLMLDYGDRPHEIVFVPSTGKVYVTTEGSGALIAIDAAAEVIEDHLALGAHARAITVTGDGSRAFISRFITEGETATVWDVDLTAMSLDSAVGLVKHTEEDTSVNGRGIFNYLNGISITPDQSQAWVAATKANIDRGGFVEGGFGQPNSEAFQNTVRPAHCVIDLSTGAEDLGLRFDHDNQSFPSAIVFSPMGDYAFVALRGNNEILVYDVLDGTMTKRNVIPTELSPDGLRFDAASRSLIVKNFMSRSIQVFDVSGFLDLRTPEVLSATVGTVASEALAADVLLGKQIFYNAADTRMAADGYISCASCHDDGGTDNIVWDFTERGEGLRNTITLIGRSGMGHGRVHWSANFDEIQDFEHDIRGPQSGSGFMDNAAFNTGTRNVSLGDPKAGSSAELDALAAYVASLNEYPKSPYRNADGTMTSAALSGAEHFKALNCAQCHAGSDYTDSARLIRHNIGTMGSGSGQRLGDGLLDGVDTPTLRGIWKTAPYLHDGSASLVSDVFSETNAPNGTVHARVRSLSAAHQAELIEYLLQLDGSNGPAPQNAADAKPVWHGLDIGSPAFAGSAADKPDTRGLTMHASGSDIWGNADHHHFVHRTDIVGDVEIIARVEAVENVNTWAKAGLMIRDSLSSDAANIMAFMRPDGNALMQRRNTTGGSSGSSSVNMVSVGFPQWLRLVRTGDSFSGYYASDGAAWSSLNYDSTISMTSNAVVGLAVTSHNNNKVATAEFSNVLVSYARDGYSYVEWLYINGYSSTTDPEGDDDGDGVNNFNEFYANRNPLVDEGRTNLPALELTPSGLELNYSRLKTEQAGDYVEVSEDLVSWRPGIEGIDYTVASVSTNAGDADQEDISLTISQPVGADKLFMRIRITPY